MASEETVETCLFCGGPYVRVDPLQLFCSRTCRRKARKRRQCPHPEKLKYKDEATAVAICEMNGWDNQRPYKCQCGMWHTTKSRLRRGQNSA